MSPEAMTGHVDERDELRREGVVRAARVHLLRRARVQGENRRARLDEARADGEAVARAVPQAAAHLHRDRHVDRLRNGGDDPAGEIGVVEQRRPCAGLRHLAHGTAEVDVHEVGSGGLDHPGGLRHRIGPRAEDLDREGVLVGCDSEIAERLLVAVLDPGAGDHLGADETRPETASLAAERLHADARHRREDEARRDLDVVDEPALPKVDLHARNGRYMPFARVRPATATLHDRPDAPIRARKPLAAPGGSVLKEVLLTPEGYEKLTQELELLRTDRRREVADRIRVAREFGEIAENAEYDDAKNEQAMLEHKIAQLEERLLNARVIDTADVDTSVVSVGSVVRLRDVDAKETVEYHIVGSAEANPAERKLSNESPVGRAIIGHKKGETVEVQTPRGSTIKFKIMEIKAA